MRHIRLQLKTGKVISVNYGIESYFLFRCLSGYMKEEPEIYSFMKRYPPLIRTPDVSLLSYIKRVN